MNQEQRADWPLRWLDLNGHRALLGALTGLDRRVLLAIDACWVAYAVAGDEARRSIWSAITDLFRTMQPKCWPLALELAARAMDWDDRERLRQQMLQYTAPENHAHLYLLRSTAMGGE